MVVSSRICMVSTNALQKNVFRKSPFVHAESRNFQQLLGLPRVHNTAAVVKWNQYNAFYEILRHLKVYLVNIMNPMNVRNPHHAYIVVRNCSSL